MIYNAPFKSFSLFLTRPSWQVISKLIINVLSLSTLEHLQLKKQTTWNFCFGNQWVIVNYLCRLGSIQAGDPPQTWVLKAGLVLGDGLGQSDCFFHRHLLSTSSAKLLGEALRGSWEKGKGYRKGDAAPVQDRGRDSPEASVHRKSSPHTEVRLNYSEAGKSSRTLSFGQRTPLFNFLTVGASGIASTY